MSGLMAMLPSLGSMFGGAAGAAGAAGSSVAPAMTAGALSNFAGDAVSAAPAASTTANLANIGSSMDPTTQALLKYLQGQQGSPWMAALQGLSPIGNTLLSANILPKQLAPQAAASHGGAQQPQTMQLSAGAPPNSPIAMAQLIAQLL